MPLQENAKGWGRQSRSGIGLERIDKKKGGKTDDTRME